jgi:hypothetical protein
MKVFLDACILYSAARPASLMAKFIERLLREAEGCTNAYVLEEARRNLELHEPANVGHLNQLAARLTVVPAISSLSEIQLRTKDRPILGGAVAGRCTHLLTSDRRDFGTLFGQIIHGVKVVSPQQLAEELGLKPRTDADGQG